MLQTKEIIEIAKRYIEIVTRGEGDIFPSYIEFGMGIMFNYQSKAFIEGNKKALWFGDPPPFIIEKECGLIYHILNEDISEEQLIVQFLSNIIQGSSLAEISNKFSEES